MKILSILPTLILTLLISSCGTMPGMSVLMAKKEAAKLRPAYNKFQELCKGDNLPRFNKALNIKGYLSASTYGLNCDFDGWDSISEGQLEFFECSEKAITSYYQLQDGPVFRFEIIKRDNKKCPEYKFIADKYIKKYSSERSDLCLIKEKVNEPKSNYARLSEWGYIDKSGNTILSMNNEKTKDIISFRGYSIVEIDSGRLLSVLNRKYTYIPNIEEDYINYKCEYESPDDFRSMIDGNLN